MCAQRRGGSDLFGGEPPDEPVDSRSPVTGDRGPAADRKCHPLGPWFDSIAELIGRTPARASAGRVLKLAKQMKEAGLDPMRLRRELPAVVARYAGWRRVIDLAAVQCCWGWILEPPKEVGPVPPAAFAESALKIARGEL